MMSLMAKLILAVTLTDPITMIKMCNSVDLSLSWIDENNDRSSKQKLDCFAYGRSLDKTHVRKVSS